jgi:hypothetical protein
MDGPDLRDCRLTDVIEAQQFLLLSLVMAMESACGLSPHAFGRTVRRAAEANAHLRPGVKTAIAGMCGVLEAPPAAKAPLPPESRWTPRLHDGGRAADDPEPRRNGRSWAPAVVDGKRPDEE